MSLITISTLFEYRKSMVKLQETLVYDRTKCSLQNVQRLNLWGCDIDDIELVSKMPGLVVLSLSANQVSELHHVAHCPLLEELYLRKNSIEDLTQVEHLTKLPNLRTLWLDENPCANETNYRLKVIRYLPRLKMLDNRPVKPEEVKAATSGEPLDTIEEKIDKDDDLMSASMHESICNDDQQSVVSAVTPHNLMKMIQSGQMQNYGMPQGAALSVVTQPETQAHNHQSRSQLPHSQSAHAPNLMTQSYHPVISANVFQPVPIAVTQGAVGQSMHSIPHMMSASYHPQLSVNDVITLLNASHGQQQRDAVTPTPQAVASSRGISSDMDQSWHQDFEFEDEIPTLDREMDNASPVGPLPTHHFSTVPRRRNLRSRSVSPSRFANQSNILCAITALMDDLDTDSLRLVMQEAQKRMKKFK